MVYSAHGQVDNRSASSDGGGFDETSVRQNLSQLLEESAVILPNSMVANKNNAMPWDGCLQPPYPTSMRHMVEPPSGPVNIVCCNTTKGVLNIEVHPSWAPLGAQRFMMMVEDGFFNTNVALFRALKGFLVQFYTCRYL